MSQEVEALFYQQKESFRQPQRKYIYDCWLKVGYRLLLCCWVDICLHSGGFLKAFGFREAMSLFGGRTIELMSHVSIWTIHLFIIKIKQIQYNQPPPTLQMEYKNHMLPSSGLNESSWI